LRSYRPLEPLLLCLCVLQRKLPAFQFGVSQLEFRLEVPWHGGNVTSSDLRNLCNLWTVFLLHRPTASAIEAFLADGRNHRLSYEPIGIAKGDPRGYQLDDVRVEVGAGAAAFERAKAALLDWEMFNTGFTEVFPARASTEDGSNVAVLIRHFGFWSLNASRVVYQIREEDSGEIRFGFAYGTLTDHGERGEEVFAACFHRETQKVSYWLRAASQPAALLARLGYPFVRHLQARFRRASCDAMVRAVGR